MSVRELVVLGTASMVPTRTRAHQAAALRWDDEVVLLDPGEGTQRQLTFAGLGAASITRLCLTHLHGDHCLGLPGVLQRMVVDGVTRPVDLYFPASGLPYVERLLDASAAVATPDVRLHPVSAAGRVDDWGGLVLSAGELDHRVETYGWRFQEPDGRRMLPEALAARGIAGPAVGELQRAGSLVVDGRRVALEEVSEPRPGQSFAFVMDTRWCDGALDLAADVDLLVSEATYLDGEEELADRYAHLTAGQAGRLAAEAGARRLVLTHYSARHPDEEPFARDAGGHHPDVHAARDLDLVAVPARR
ncbi:ribonuclease Z [Nocardioides sp. IC4_145]|uniref:ribonuclease Z n=1 Tax=Nocardioides sp. IC4_145 TaxID=2714037 RepID=UPI00140AA49D|nr:ribonuclease Z [Nocardioides sp. IC4_145]NHC24833.1 ribonuclease Z [Nocardioides sp. IC4_145]